MSSFDESARQAARERVQWLLVNQCKIPVRPSLPINYYYKNSDDLIDEADFSYNNQQLEQSFILYSRYITLFIEGLKLHHPGYATASINDRGRVKEIMRSRAMPRAEELKTKLMEKYAREYELEQKAIQEAENAKVSAAPLSKQPANFHTENAQAFEKLKSNYAQVPPANVALFAVPANDSGLVSAIKEPVK